MHRTRDCVGNTRVLESCPAQRLSNELVVALGAFASLKPSVIATSSRCLNRYGLTKRTHLPPASLNIAKTTWYSKAVAQRMC